MNDKNPKNITILSIETSCDETGISIIQYDENNNKYEIIADTLNSQIDIHKDYGGVFPTIAKREHGNNLLDLLKICLIKLEKTSIYINENNINFDLINKENELTDKIKEELKNKDSILYNIPNIDYIAVTSGPGLEPALWVGLSFTKFLAKLWNKAIIPINHMEGHISSILIENKNDITFPSLGLLISGGHTELVDIKNWGQYNILGKTRDDAVGEAYDKVARILGLPYPGGPEIALRAKKLRDRHDQNHITTIKNANNIKLPRPMKNSQDIDFSFSGLKTAVLYLVRDLKKNNNFNEDIIDQICHEFEESVSDVLISKLTFAIRNTEKIYINLIVAGGVIANEFLKENINNWCIKYNINFLKPEKKLATDNALMIGLAAIVGIKNKYAKIIHIEDEEFIKIKPDGDWSLNNI